MRISIAGTPEELGRRAAAEAAAYLNEAIRERGEARLLLSTGASQFTTLEALDTEALVKILSKPKNALLKQYVQLFELDNVTLEFTDEALRAVAEKTLKRNTGARGLRAVMEELLTELMFEIPSDPTIAKVVIDRPCVEAGAKPELVIDPQRKAARLKPPVKKNTNRKVTA